MLMWSPFAYTLYWTSQNIDVQLSTKTGIPVSVDVTFDNKHK